MSWFKLKRLLSHRKVWKLLTKKLPLKLRRSKPKKKRSYKTCKKLGWPSLSIQPKKFKKKPNSHALRNLHRSPPPVFVDELFKEPVSAVKVQVLPPKGVQASKEKLEHGKEEGSVDDVHNNMVNADDVWESMALASPHMMHGINQRADEFIARFRADMRHQEMMARRL